MSGRVSVLTCVNAANAIGSPFVPWTRAFASSSVAQASTVSHKRKNRDPYALAQARARKAANLSRQEVLKRERAVALGDPVRGEETDYLRSFDELPTESAVSPSPAVQSQVSARRPFAEEDAKRNNQARQMSNRNITHILGKARRRGLDFMLAKGQVPKHEGQGFGRKFLRWLAARLDPEIEMAKWMELHSKVKGYAKPVALNDSGNNIRNFFIRQSELEHSLNRSRALATSTSGEDALSLAEDFTNAMTPEQRQAEADKRHGIAEEALRRISSLSLGSSKDRLRMIKQRCIEDFGRHTTEQFLPPKPALSHQGSSRIREIKTPRAGPDTGSSEVQVAILTAKIRTVADFLDSRGTQDKVNKRNLRLLVHRRQKLLRYLERKERAGPRFQNLITTLGLTEGTWQGEISL